MSESHWEQEKGREISEATKAQLELFVSGMIHALERRKTKAEIEGDQFSVGFYARKIEEAETLSAQLHGALTGVDDLDGVIAGIQRLDGEITDFRPREKIPTHPTSN